MPLFIDCRSVQDVPSSISAFLQGYPLLKDGATKLTQIHLQSISPESLVYVYQREYAVVHPQDDQIDYIGSEDATTCHILVLRNTGSGVTALAHCDGVNTSSIVVSMVTDILKLSVGGPEGRLECHIVGGFIDPRKESVKLSAELLKVLIDCDKDIHLMTACFTDMNDVIRNGVHFPVILGLCVEVKTGRIFPATFPDKGPDAHIRGALAFAGYTKVHNVYDSDKSQLVVGPYTWKPMPYLMYYLEKSDAYIRKHLSTSPEQEPEGFEDHVRTSLTTLLQHPSPMVTLFAGGLARRYHMSSPGQWTRVGGGGGAGDGGGDCLEGGHCLGGRDSGIKQGAVDM